MQRGIVVASCALVLVMEGRMRAAYAECYYDDVFGRACAIHVSGFCSQSWTDGRGSPALGDFRHGSGCRPPDPWALSQDAELDMTQPIEIAAAQLASVLNRHCTPRGPHDCVIYNWSAGVPVTNYLLSNSPPYSWYIWHVASSAGADGGTNLAGDLGLALTGCAMARQLRPADMRGLYNHYDTGETQQWRVGGTRPLLETTLGCFILDLLTLWLFGDFCVSPLHDGVIGYDSSAAYIAPGQYDVFWENPPLVKSYPTVVDPMHWGSGWVVPYPLNWWSGSYGDPPVWHQGEYLDHFQIKMLPVCLESGMPQVCQTGCFDSSRDCTSQCVSYLQTR